MIALPLNYLLILLVLSLIGLIFWLYKKVDRQSQLIQDLRLHGERWRIYPDQKTIQEAVDKANQIVTHAEVESLKTEAEKEMELGLFSSKFQNEFQNNMSQILSKLETSVDSSNGIISQSINQAAKKHDDFLIQLQKQNLDWQNNMETEIKAKTNDLLGSFEQRMTDFFQTAQKDSLGAIDIEIKSARALIDSYKSQQLAVVNENIVAVLERTLNLVIKKKLSLKDQMDLVYEALEKAKLEKFLV